MTETPIDTPIACAGGARRGDPHHEALLEDGIRARRRLAVAALVARGLPLTLVPHDAARRIEISAADLDRKPWLVEQLAR